MRVKILTGKTVIVTGASSGIGAAIAQEIANEGANVVLVARNKEKLENIAAKISKDQNTICVPIDVTKKQDVEFLVKRTNEVFGNVDILVNNAGQMSSSKIIHGEVSDWDQMIDINVKGVLYGIDSVLPQMLARKTGHIVNIASDLGFEVIEDLTVYSATKFAVRAISMGLEKELAKTGVRTTNISPGMVDTPLGENSPTENPGQKLEPKDIAKAVIYAVTQPDYVNVNEITVRPI